MEEFTGEVWKKLEFTDNKYEISNYGRVKSFCVQQDGKIVKPSLIKGFYAYSFPVGDKKKKLYIHKLVAENFVEKESEDKNRVIHLDWDKTNNYFENLEWVTAIESLERNRKKTKEEGSLSDLNLDKDSVIMLKYMIERNIPAEILAKLFRLTIEQINQVENGDIYSEVSVPKDFSV